MFSMRLFGQRYRPKGYMDNYRHLLTVLLVF
jgi:hypothetical protein